MRNPHEFDTHYCRLCLLTVKIYNYIREGEGEGEGKGEGEREREREREKERKREREREPLVYYLQYKPEFSSEMVRYH